MAVLASQAGCEDFTYGRSKSALLAQSNAPPNGAGMHVRRRSTFTFDQSLNRGTADVRPLYLSACAHTRGSEY